MHFINSVVPASTPANKAEHAPPTIVAYAVLLLIGALSACADYDSHEKCGKGECSDDANITAKVQGAFAQRSELKGPDQLYVETVDHVVFLSGTVDTGLHRDIAASVAREVSGVTRVVNNIAIEK